MFQVHQHEPFRDHELVNFSQVSISRLSGNKRWKVRVQEALTWLFSVQCTYNFKLQQPLFFTASWAKIHTCKKQSGLDCTGTFCLYVAFPFVFHTSWPAEPSNILTCKKIEQFSLIIALCVKGGPLIKRCKKLAKVNLGFSSKKITNSYLLLFLSS